MQNPASKLKTLAIFVCLAAAYSVSAQDSPTDPPKRVTRVAPVRPPLPPRPAGPQGHSEKAIAADQYVNIKLPCIAQARVTVNGWRRNEIRVFVRNGSEVSFKVHEKDPKSGLPVWVLITRQADGTRPGPFSECINGERIDIEVPFGASLSISGREAETIVDSVKKVNLMTAGGKVSLRNIPGGIAAKTYEGDLVVESSAGQIMLETTKGNVAVFDVSPGEVGDMFNAKTQSGTLSLQNVEHRQIDANSVSGTLLFNGKFLPGGIYNFKTANGSMKLALPAATSCRLAAWFGFGSIESELPLKVITENVSSGGKSINALIGDGSATVKLTTSSGTISIIKQEKL